VSVGTSAGSAAGRLQAPNEFRCGASGAAGGGAGSSAQARRARLPRRAASLSSDVVWKVQEGDLWISPDGNDGNPHRSEPKKDLSAALSAWSFRKTTGLRRARTLKLHRSTVHKATARGSLRISAPTDGAKPIFDFSVRAARRNNNGHAAFKFGIVRAPPVSGDQKASDNCVYVTAPTTRSNGSMS